MSVGIVNAVDQEEIVGYGMAKNTIDIKFPCRALGAICDPSYSCNATVYNLAGNRLLNNIQTTRNSADYNFTLLNNFTQTFGFYRVESTCTNNMFNGSETYFIEITANGKPSTPYQFVYILILIAILFILFNKFLNRTFNLNIFGIFSGILFTIAGVLTLYPGFNYINWTNLEGLGLGVILIGLGGLLITKELEAYV